jgi:hypothetical protein
MVMSVVGRALAIGGVSTFSLNALGRAYPAGPE